ncbi:MAG: hypothetical protein U0271_04265 [Polyangiaceae bacterium]
MYSDNDVTDSGDRSAVYWDGEFVVAGADPIDDELAGHVVGRSRRALVAEGDRALLELLGRSLAREGYEIVDCHDSAELVKEARREWLLKEPPALIVTDAATPGCAALEVLDALDALGWGVPVFVLTADERLGRELSAHGARPLAPAADAFHVDCLVRAALDRRSTEHL